MVESSVQSAGHRRRLKQKRKISSIESTTLKKKLWRFISGTNEETPKQNGGRNVPANSGQKI